jgi:hypothetical protein
MTAKLPSQTDIPPPPPTLLAMADVAVKHMSLYSLIYSLSSYIVFHILIPQGLR